MAEGIERRRLRVYLAGPMTKGSTFGNVVHAITWGKQLLADGFAPYIPQLDAFMMLADDEPKVEWPTFLEWDLEWVKVSEAVLRLPGESKGADLEVERAMGEGIPIFLVNEQTKHRPELDYGYGMLKDYAVLKDLTGVRL